jgi:predicted secreted protein
MRTAVEWLVEELTKQNMFMHLFAKEIEQAKEMEKQQVIDAWNDGYREFYDGSSTPEEYYNQTFKSE